MSKIIITADVHLGVQGRLHDIMWSLRVMSEYGLRDNIDLFMVLGDLFHDRKSIDIDVLCSSFDFFSEVKNKGQSWLTFPGNHDMFLKHSWKINSLKPLNGLVEVINTIKIVKVDNCRFWILPFIHLESAYMKCLKYINNDVEDGDILLTHIGVRSAVLNTCFLLRDWSYVDFSETKFDRIYTGHFHSTQKVGEKVYYPGSPIPFKFDEGDVPHGFFVFDTDTRTHEFVNIWEAGKQLFPNEPQPPQFSSLSDDLIATKTKEEISGSCVRVMLTKEWTEAEKRSVREDLAAKGALEVRFVTMTSKEDVAAEIKVAQSGLQSADKLFEAWIEKDESGSKGLNKNLLRRLNREIVLEGDEIYCKTRTED